MTSMMIAMTCARLRISSSSNNTPQARCVRCDRSMTHQRNAHHLLTL